MQLLLQAQRLKGNAPANNDVPFNQNNLHLGTVLKKYIDKFASPVHHTVDVVCPEVSNQKLTVKSLVLNTMGVVSTQEVDNQHDSALALLAILGMVPELSFLWHKTKEHLQCNSCRDIKDMI